MGIHVALTGVRGIIMPFVGSTLYNLIGSSALAIAIALSGAAVAAFRRLARSSP